MDGGNGMQYNADPNATQAGVLCDLRVHYSRLQRGIQ